ncbi:type II secretion system protein M [Agaribacter marinus]|uniref:Type II secretion system protein M n=1 Tax=Agaribacter marinus TaxID=1431249 RepID=A0AA37WHU6_9ALTE|nr:type II secretion system protein M [Agaribacter marinus]GLR71446.1 type II secretion system protein M [Agaribacter marinus]
MNAVSQWFKSLSEREKLIVLIGGGVGIIALFYFAIWAPLNQAIDENKSQLSNAKALNVWIQERASRAQLLKQSGQAKRFSGSLTQLVNQTTRGANISVSRMQPQGEGLQVWIDAVPFNNLLRWLDTLEKQGVTIIQSDISETDNPGIVQVRRLQLGKS